MLLGGAWICGAGREDLRVSDRGPYDFGRADAGSCWRLARRSFFCVGGRPESDAAPPVVRRSLSATRAQPPRTRVRLGPRLARARVVSPSGSSPPTRDAVTMPPKRKAEAFAPRDGTAADVVLSPVGTGATAPSEEEQREAWASLAARLRATRGGEMHPNVGVGWGGAIGRGLVALGPIPSGAVIFRIPPSCTLSARDALRSDVGRLVVDAAARARPPCALPLGDVALAAHVAVHAATRPDSPFAPYHRLLDAETFDDSPAWWPPERLDALLTGTHVHPRAVGLRTDARDAFERLAKDAMASEGLVDPHDAWRRFRRALVAVHSRSFHLRSDAGTVEDEAAGGALVPLLDCANHHRKPRECEWETVTETRDDGSDPDQDTNRRVVVVRAVRDFAAGDPVRVAYGARGNGDLALRYGFTIPANIEPDGSHNDVVPVRVWASVSTREGEGDDPAPEREVTLRMAPSPAYTAGDFADALDAVAGRPRYTVGRGARGDAPEGEDFLGAGFGEWDAAEDERDRAADEEDGEDDEGEDDDDAWEAMYGGGDVDREEDGDERVHVDVDDAENGLGVGDVDDLESLAREAAALEALRDRLRELGRLALGSEPPANAEDAEDAAEAGRRRDAARLRASEVRTLAFFETAAERVRVVVAAAKDAPKNRRREIARDAVAASAASPPTAPRFEGAEWGADQDGTENAALEERAFAPGVTSLVDAYFKIRHPGW